MTSLEQLQAAAAAFKDHYMRSHAGLVEQLAVMVAEPEAPSLPAPGQQRRKHWVRQLLPCVSPPPAPFAEAGHATGGASTGYPTGWWRQARVLAWRELLKLTRNPADVAGRTLTFTWVALLVGLYYYDLPEDANSIRQVRVTGLRACCMRSRRHHRAPAPARQRRRRLLTLTHMPRCCTAAAPPAAPQPAVCQLLLLPADALYQPEHLFGRQGAVHEGAGGAAVPPVRTLRRQGALAAARACMRACMQVRLHAARRPSGSIFRVLLLQAAMVLPFNVMLALSYSCVQYGLTGMRPGASVVARHCTLASLMSLIATQVRMQRTARGDCGCNAVRTCAEVAVAVHAGVPSNRAAGAAAGNDADVHAGRRVHDGHQLDMHEHGARWGGVHAEDTHAWLPVRVGVSRMHAPSNTQVMSGYFIRVAEVKFAALANLRVLSALQYAFEGLAQLELGGRAFPCPPAGGDSAATAAFLAQLLPQPAGQLPPALLQQLVAAGGSSRRGGGACTVDSSALTSQFGFSRSFAQSAGILAGYLAALHVASFAAVMLVARRRERR